MVDHRHSFRHKNLQQLWSFLLSFPYYPSWCYNLEEVGKDYRSYRIVLRRDSLPEKHHMGRHMVFRTVVFAVVELEQFDMGKDFDIRYQCTPSVLLGSS